MSLLALRRYAEPSDGLLASVFVNSLRGRYVLWLSRVHMTVIDSVVAAAAGTVLSAGFTLRLTRTTRQVESADEAFGAARAALATRRRDLQALYASHDLTWTVPGAAPLLTKPEWISQDRTMLEDVVLDEIPYDRVCCIGGAGPPVRRLIG